MIVVLLCALSTSALDRQDPDWSAPLDKSSNYLPRWSPDGTQLVFYRRLPEGWRIFLVDANGGNLRQVSHGPGNDYQPAWSPDGASIVFDSDRGGNRDIYRMTLATGHIVRVTDSPSRDTMPAWSPDGRLIAFLSDREDGTHIWTVAVDATLPARVTREAPRNILRPMWSPDGRRLAFAGADRSDETKRRVYVFDLSDRSLRAITAPGDAGNPSWSPDGRRLVFDASPDGRDDTSGGQWELWIVEADGSNLQRLTNDTANDWGPSWSRDGRTIAFSRGRNDQYEIYRSILGGTPQRLTRNVYR